MTAPHKTESRTFSVDARTILTLGRQSIRDHLTALLELVKNSWDADASRVEIGVFCKDVTRHIRITDNGSGMTEEEVDRYWLRIGFSEKRVKRISEGRRRRKTGEKGIGRISADRLGAHLELRTKAKRGRYFGLSVNWDDFDVDGKDLSNVAVAVLEDARFDPLKGDGGTDIERSGTELTIRGLRQGWTKDDMEALHSELALLRPPFQGVADFTIHLESDVAPELNGDVASPFLDVSEIQFDATLEDSNISYSILDRIEVGKTRTQTGEISWSQLVQRTPRTGDSPTAPRTGPVRVVLLFYPRKASFLVGTEIRLTELREFLDRNAGVRLYRDQIRVRPYGDPRDPAGDWLGLAERRTREPAGVARPTYKVAANQLVGAVFIGRDENPALVDSASREGLIEDDSFRDLRALVLGALTILEAHRHEAYRSRDGQDEAIRPKEDLSRLRKELRTLRSDLQAVRKAVPRSAGRPVTRVMDQMEVVVDRIRAAESSLGEVMSQAGVLRGLATLGIATSVFAHETQAALGEFIGATFAAASLLEQERPDVTSALDEIQKAKKYAQQVNAWGAFSLARVRRDKRTRRAVRIDFVTSAVIKDVSVAFQAASIELDPPPDLEEITASTFAMDIEAIVVNLLANAYVACQQARRPRRIGVILRDRTRTGTPGFDLVISDSGPGVPKDLRERIWRPLFTTRRDASGHEAGTGLGLSIVDSIVKDLGGWRSVDSDPHLMGARFTVWMPSASK